jgi:hypothetical protein
MTQRLTPDALRKMLRVEPEIMRIASAAAAPLSQQPAEPVLEEDAAAARLEAIPEIRRSLTANEWNARDFLRTVAAAIRTVLAIDMMDAGRLTQDPSGVMRENIELWRNPPPDLAAALAEWKRREMDAILQTLRH